MPVRAHLAAFALVAAFVATFPAVAETKTAPQAPLKTAPVLRASTAAGYRAEGVVEAIRHAEIAPQVPGRVTEVRVKAGDRVKAGVVLALIDARAARDEQTAARAELQAAQREYERSRELFAKNFISKTAMDRIEAQYRTARARANVAGTQEDFHRITAPYAGIVAQVHGEVGDMAQPGKALLSFYDPKALRVTVQVPESVAVAIVPTQPVAVEIPAAEAAQRRQTGKNTVVLPTADVGAHTREVRVDLAATATVSPGTFARVELPLAGDSSARLSIPWRAVVIRSEFNGVYVIDAKGQPQLRQVRLGRQHGDRVEILAGLREGERVALEPLAALRRLSDGAGSQ